MSLEDRVHVNIGDLVKFESESTTVIGYVRQYSDREIKLSNCSPFPNTQKRQPVLQRYCLEKKYVLKLAQFDKYYVVERFVPSHVSL